MQIGLKTSAESLATALLRKLRAAIRLARPVNMIIVGVGVVTGAALVLGTPALEGEHLTRVLFAAMSAALVAGAANALNDVFDVEIDLRNRPDRPIPAGAIGKTAAMWVWAVLSALGLALAFWVSLRHALFAMVLIALLFSYDAWLKRMPGVGHLVVASAVAATLVYGGMAVGDPAASFLGAAFAFVTTLARELIKGLEDEAGDSAHGAKTLPVVLGPKWTRRIAVVLLLATVVVLPVPFVLGFGGLYLIIGSGAAGLLIASAWNLYGYEHADYHRASGLIKFAMLFGLAALLVANVDG